MLRTSESGVSAPVGGRATRLGEREREKLTQAATVLRKAERGVRVLRTVAWPADVATRFFERGARDLPQVMYAAPDPGPALAEVEAARRLIDGSSPVHRWLARVARAIATGAEMLAAVGTREFHRRSCELYGTPTRRITDGILCPLDLARHLDETLDHFLDSNLMPTPERQDVEAVAVALRHAVTRHFEDKAPEVEVVDNLSANSLAGARYIRLRRGALFSDRDVQQLIHHEAYVHIGTTLNGVEQRSFPVLAAGHPGTTRTQEGLAVFGEFISGSMDLDRLRRLGDRVIAIQMAMDGADFLDVYRFFLGRTHNLQQAFENARRVFRGGVLAGGAPFTKDGVYLEGLLRVHNFLRAVVQLGRIDCLQLLFCGKIDIEDVPALAMLASEGLCEYPRFLPPWAADLRFLAAYLAYSAFLNQVDMTAVRAHYAELLGCSPSSPAPSASQPVADDSRESGWPL
ncbi:MAG TPA: flavohemoglobin expression-modulating QEGLA motif protein [Kofleriaceae bacterium]|nr:flavohemoglobin expression-modulating QEGLA motif protein [Kofleriaceae bacterium]